MPEPFSILKALDFTLPAIGKAVSVVVKGLIVLGLIAVVAWSIYVTIIKPHINPTPTTNVESGGVSNTYNIRSTFGCMRLPIKPEAK